MKHARDDYNGRIVDLQNRIPEDEPVFLLRAQDKFAAEALRYYATLVAIEMGSDFNIVRETRSHADLMDQWLTKKIPDMPGQNYPEGTKISHVEDSKFVECCHKVAMEMDAREADFPESKYEAENDEAAETAKEVVEIIKEAEHEAHASGEVPPLPDNVDLSNEALFKAKGFVMTKRLQHGEVQGKKFPIPFDSVGNKVIVKKSSAVEIKPLAAGGIRTEDKERFKEMLGKGKELPSLEKERKKDE